jgi:hypothetical protein
MHLPAPTVSRAIGRPVLLLLPVARHSDQLSLSLEVEWAAPPVFIACWRCSSRKAVEELCVVIDGSWQLKLDDTLLDGGPSDVFRVARVARGF